MEGNKSDIVELLKQNIKILLHSGFNNLIPFKERRNGLLRRTPLTNQPPDLRPDRIKAETQPVPRLRIIASPARS